MMLAVIGFDYWPILGYDLESMALSKWLLFIDFQTIVRWVKFDQDSRLPDASKLLACVRFEYLTIDDFIHHVEPESWMLNDSDWKLVYSGMKCVQQLFQWCFKDLDL